LRNRLCAALDDASAFLNLRRLFQRSLKQDQKRFRTCRLGFRDKLVVGAADKTADNIRRRSKDRKVLAGESALNKLLGIAAPDRIALGSRQKQRLVEEALDSILEPREEAQRRPVSVAGGRDVRG